MSGTKNACGKGPSSRMNALSVTISSEAADILEGESQISRQEQGQEQGMDEPLTTNTPKVSAGSKQSSQTDTLVQENQQQPQEEDATQNDTAANFCLSFPSFHWSKKEPRMLAGDQFAYDIWHNPREEIDETPARRRFCCTCGIWCTCGPWSWLPYRGGH